MILEKLVNNTDEEIAKTQPKYVVTRQDKIFFFTDGAPNARPEGLKPRIGKELVRIWICYVLFLEHE